MAMVPHVHFGMGDGLQGENIICFFRLRVKMKFLIIWLKEKRLYAIRNFKYWFIRKFIPRELEQWQGVSCS